MACKIRLEQQKKHTQLNVPGRDYGCVVFWLEKRVKTRQATRHLMSKAAGVQERIFVETLIEEEHAVGIWARHVLFLLFPSRALTAAD